MNNHISSLLHVLTCCHSSVLCHLEDGFNFLCCSHGAYILPVDGRIIAQSAVLGLDARVHGGSGGRAIGDLTVNVVSLKKCVSLHNELYYFFIENITRSKSPGVSANIFLTYVRFA